jgi:cell division protein FtsZ
VDFVVANTDAQALAQSKAERKIQLGVNTTEGLGAGAQPEVGRAGAEESMQEIMEHLSGAHMVFIAAGMGGGTGTGAAPVIARAVREAGILTVGVVTKPFALEGDRRMRVAERGIAELQQFVHTLIVIPNQNLFRVANDRTTMSQAFAMADEVLHAGVRGVTDLIVMPGLINLDFADIKSVISEMGKAMMGTGEAEGEERAMRAADMAISNPLLDDVTMKGAKGVLINITGGPDLMLFEVEQAANRIRAEVDPDANIIFGNTILPDMEGRIRVSVVATGIDADVLKLPEKVHALRPNLRPMQPFRLDPAKPAAPVNPVQAQMDSLAAELNANGAPSMQADEAYILGGNEAPAIEEKLPEEAPIAATRYAATESYRPLNEQPLARPQPGKKGGWSLFGRRKTPVPDMRAEPKAEPRRATAQPMQRAAAPDPLPPAGEDLFPDHGSDDQFEIPAFLRRQSN